MTQGLVGWYTGVSWTGSQWTDLSSAGNHVTNVSGTITSATEASATGANYLNGQPYLYGGTTASLTFPSTILPYNYTLFSLARWNGGTTGRIVTAVRAGVTPNWYSGHQGGKAGVALHSDKEGRLTPYADSHGSKWVLSADTRFQ